MPLKKPLSFQMTSENNDVQRCLAVCALIAKQAKIECADGKKCFESLKKISPQWVGLGGKLQPKNLGRTAEV